MKNHRNVAQDINGNAILGATVTIKDAATGTALPTNTIYSTNTGTPKTNPFTASTTDGEFEFYAANGRYTVSISATGYTGQDYDILLEETITKSTKAEVAALFFSQYDDGTKVFITSDDGGEFTVRYNATPTTYDDDGGSYCGTQFIPTGGDGTIGIVRDMPKNEVTPSMFGGVQGSDSASAIQEMLDFAGAQYNTSIAGFDYQVDFESVNWIVGTSIDLTEIRQPGITLKNGGLYGTCTGKIVLDGLGTNTPNFENFRVYGDETSVPSVGIAVGRGAAGAIAPSANLINVRVDGEFSKIGFLNFGSEVSNEEGCYWKNDSTSTSAYAAAYVGDYATLTDYVGGLTSEYTTLTTSTVSNVLHKAGRAEIVRGHKIYFPTISSITQATTAVVTVPVANMTTAVALGFANGSEVFFQSVGGMTELNHNYYTVANLNAGAGTFELSGVNSTGFGAFTSGGTIRNRTGPALLLGSVRSLKMVSSYMLTYGSPAIIMDLDNGSGISDLDIDAQVEASPDSIVRMDCTASKVIQNSRWHFLNASQDNADHIFGRTGVGGTVRFDNVEIDVVSMSTAPTNGVFEDPTEISLRNANIQSYLSASLNTISDFIEFSGVQYAAADNTWQIAGLKAVTFNSSHTPTTQGELGYDGRSLLIYDGAARKIAAVYTTTSTALLDKTNAVNTTGKYNGKTVANSTTNLLYTTYGATDVSPWYPSDGGAAITPV